ncbi:MAG: hypothetical protein ACUVR4_05870 [Anaerolineae bacterium]
MVAPVTVCVPLPLNLTWRLLALKVPLLVQLPVTLRSPPELVDKVNVPSIVTFLPTVKAAVFDPMLKVALEPT